METIIKPKSLSQSLTESEFKEINYSVDSMYKTMQAIVQSWLQDSYELNILMQTSLSITEIYNNFKAHFRPPRSPLLQHSPQPAQKQIENN